MSDRVPAAVRCAGAALLCALAVAACDDDGVGPRTAPPASGSSGAAEAGAGPGAGAGGGSGGAGMGPDAGAGGTAGGAGRTLPKPDVDAILEGGCATSTLQSELLPSNLLFVIDRSSSMACNPPPDTDSAACELDSVRANPFLPSKWEITRDALVDAIDRLPRDTVVGLSYFSNDDGCGVHSMPSVALADLDGAQRSAIRASLFNVQPRGATPIVGAVILAYRHLHAEALAQDIRGNKFVVLLTDGEQSETCSDPPRCDGPEECTELLIGSEVPKAAGPGVWIKTFVIGAPGSEPARAVLSQMALAGGTARSGCDPDAGNCHFDMTTQNASFADALSSALSAISGRAALSCELSMPRANGTDVDPMRVNVVYSPGDGGPPQLVLQDERFGCELGANGWQYADGQTKIRLCGPACDVARADAAGRLDVVLGCPVRGPD